ncbi:uncharacterized protein RCC_07052 [Ramularia collo-cygni]|uniref:Uncharacterized protein n=1 Tax=Ramularia collo-cygni TaxID=112498 RepID=A0A2D3V6X3_9PEZI|nr:uncharacterized protein RCC_07052 [Ramularia collo-cygni]CZT21190.1 uncharacterized protein RCC_07052 [Ramularia collo-cygni]
MSTSTFECNVAYSVLVNKGLSIDHSDVLSFAEMWEGIRRGSSHPHEFAPYVSDCQILSGSGNRFSRRLTLADGAVHTASGSFLDQDVVIAEGLHVEAITTASGAKTTWFVSRDGSPGSNEDTDIVLNAVYELKMSDVTPGSDQANQITRDYSALALKACRDGIETIREWKRQGRLEKFRVEREAGRVYEGP